MVDTSLPRRRLEPALDATHGAVDGRGHVLLYQVHALPAEVRVGRVADGELLHMVTWILLIIT